MKNYEKLKLTVENFSASDVTTTSIDVTTENIKLPWQKSDASPSSAFEL